jgi:hypothetical protein
MRTVYIPTTLAEVYRKLDLEHPCNFAEKQIRYHLGLIDSGSLTNLEVMLGRQTGRTTLMLAQVYLDACEGVQVKVGTSSDSHRRVLKDRFTEMCLQCGIPNGFRLPQFVGRSCRDDSGQGKYYEDEITYDVKMTKMMAEFNELRKGE